MQIQLTSWSVKWKAKNVTYRQQKHGKYLAVLDVEYKYVGDKLLM